MKRVLIVVGKVLLTIILFPVALLAGAISSVFGRGEDRTRDEVASYLRNFVDGGGGQWDWDDFISIPIEDPALEGIRMRAASLDLPPTEEGMAVLRGLLAEVEQMGRA